MIIAFSSPKGGQGCTTAAAVFALQLAREVPDVVLVDLCGDVPSVLGIYPPDMGIADYLGAAVITNPGEATITRMLVDTGRDGRGLKVLPVGGKGWLETADSDHSVHLAAELANSPVTYVVDCGVARPNTIAADFIDEASRHLIVVRNCYIALRRAQTGYSRPHAVVFFEESDRPLGGRDVSEVLGLPITATIKITPEIARAIDSGILATRIHRLPDMMGARA